MPLAQNLVDQARFELASASVDGDRRPLCSITPPAHLVKTP